MTWTCVPHFMPFVTGITPMMWSFGVFYVISVQKFLSTESSCLSFADAPLTSLWWQQHRSARIYRLWWFYHICKRVNQPQSQDSLLFMTFEMHRLMKGQPLIDRVQGCEIWFTTIKWLSRITVMTAKRLNSDHSRVASYTWSVHGYQCACWCPSTQRC